MEMGDRDHQDLRRFLAILVNDPIGEAVGTAATRVLAEGTPSFGESHDSFESGLDLVSKLRTQARALGLVEPDRIPEVIATASRNWTVTGCRTPGKPRQRGRPSFAQH